MPASFTDVFYRSADGLTLYARDYAGPAPDSPAVLCMHGLTRNCRDFTGLAAHLAARYRVITPDLRGRGRSAYDPDPLNYQPLTYTQDMTALLDALGIARAALVGTSLGGIMAMIMTAAMPDRVSGVILNDVGPVVDPKGIERIKSYVGKLPDPASWPEAIAQQKILNAAIFPDYSAADWDRFAQALYRDDGGRPVLDYDPAIARGLAAGSAVPPDLWPLFDALGAKPALAIRGALSDILSAETLSAMQNRNPALATLTVPDRGHAPMLTEPSALAAIDDFLIGK